MANTLHRLFLALRPDGPTRDRLAAVADRLRAWELPAAWTHPDDYHLTLLFLGELPEDEAQLIPAAADLVAGSLRRPVLRLAGLGAAGGSRQPRAVYAACRDPEGACAAMHRDLCEALECAPQERFLPHLTVCRPRPDAEAAQRPLFRDWPHLLEAHGQADWGECRCDAVVLYRSRPEGATRYQAVAEWSLHF